MRLEGIESNRDGIGARIWVSANKRKQVQEVCSGGSYLSQSDLCVHFGLGGAERVDEVTVRWPSGRVDTLRDLPADQRLFIQEGRGLIRTMPLANRR